MPFSEYRRAFMKNNDKKPEPQPGGSMRPPRPPNKIAVGLCGEGDGFGKASPKKQVVRIVLPPKPATPPTIRPPKL
jgi:hypothetical protein